MTLHGLKVDSPPDDREFVDCGQPVIIPSGWQIAPGDAADVRVCITHPWQCRMLVFANGNAMYGTSFNTDTKRFPGNCVV
jgi:hypothetical protein